jgi:hypothetical protein
MSETPTTPPPGPDDETQRVVGGPGDPMRGVTVNWPTGARLPIPGNAEWAMWFLVELVFVIIWIASDEVDAALFVTLTAAITFAYLISRGIAKASRVLEQ